MDAKKFGEILSLAMARVTHADGSIVDPATLPAEIQHDRATEDLWIAWGFVNVAGAGPFEDQKARIEAWAAEREERFGNVRAMLQKFGIGAQVGPLELQVAELGAQRDRLRQLADVAAREIERLTKQRDAARAGIAKVFQSIEAGHLELVHEDIEHDKGRGNVHTAPCPEDDTCACPCRRVMLWLQLAAADPGSSAAIAALEGLRQAGALNETTHEVYADDPDRWAFGLVAAHRVAWMGPEAVKVASKNPEAILAERTPQHVNADLAAVGPLMTPAEAEQLKQAIESCGCESEPHTCSEDDHDHVFIDGRCACGEVMQ